MRRWLVLPAVLASGCALVSGLSQIGVSDDGGTMPFDSGAEISTSSDAAGPDVRPDTALPGMDAGRGSALQLKATCASATQSSALSFSAMPFTVSFWFRPDTTNNFGAEIHPIVWNGARSATEPGWLIGIQSATLVFCASSGTATACAASGIQLNAVNHLIHIVAVSTPSVLNRSLQLWALDTTMGQVSHMMVGQSTSAPNNWLSSAAFTVGGALGNNNGCVLNVQGVIDDLRLWSAALTPAQFDVNYQQIVSCGDANLSAYFKFDEGAGMTTADCAGKGQLTLGGTYAWLASPFP